MAYPVSITVEPQLADRNRLTTAFRLILAIPHLILVGGVGAGFACSARLRDSIFARRRDRLARRARLAPRHRQLVHDRAERSSTCRASARSRASTCAGARARSRTSCCSQTVSAVRRRPVSRDAGVSIRRRTARDRLTVGLRLILAIPHFIVLFFVFCVWWIIDGRRVVRDPDHRRGIRRGCTTSAIGAMRWAHARRGLPAAARRRLPAVLVRLSTAATDATRRCRATRDCRSRQPIAPSRRLSRRGQSCVHIPAGPALRASRTLAKQRAFTLVALLTLALGHRRQHGDLRHRQRRAAEAAAVSASPIAS